MYLVAFGLITVGSFNLTSCEKVLLHADDDVLSSRTVFYIGPGDLPRNGLSKFSSVLALVPMTALDDSLRTRS